jgi:hypothetical protein
MFNKAIILFFLLFPAILHSQEVVRDFIEVSKSVLEQEVPKLFPDRECNGQVRKMKDYTMFYYVDGEDVFMFVGHRDCDCNGSEYVRDSSTTVYEKLMWEVYFYDVQKKNIYNKSKALSRIDKKYKKRSLEVIR